MPNKIFLVAIAYLFFYVRADSTCNFPFDVFHTRRRCRADVARNSQGSRLDVASFYSWRNKTRKSVLILHSFPHLYMHRRITACIWKPCIIPRTQNCRVLSRKRWYACMCCIITDGFIQNAWTVYCPTWHLHTFHGNAPLKFRCNTNTFRTTS